LSDEGSSKVADGKKSRKTTKNLRFYRKTRKFQQTFRAIAMKTVQEISADAFLMQQCLIDHSFSFPNTETSFNACNQRRSRRRRFVKFQTFLEEFFASFGGFDDSLLWAVVVGVTVAEGCEEVCGKSDFSKNISKLLRLTWFQSFDQIHVPLR
jgi:hypothetical protein